MAAEKAANEAVQMGMKTVDVRVKGQGAGRESAIKLAVAGLEVVSIKDVTPLPHNGCRPPKKKKGLKIFMSKVDTPKGKLVRKFGENIFGNPKYDALLNKKPYTPGGMVQIEEKDYQTMEFSCKKNKK